MPIYTPALLGFAKLISRLIFSCYKHGCEELEMFNYIILLYMLYEYLLAVTIIH